MNKIFGFIYQKYEKTPNAIAVIDEKGAFTWNQLLNLSFAIANRLKFNKVKKNDTVTIELSNSKEFISTIIACQMLGAIYVPLDKLYPNDRVNYIHRDCNVKAVVDDDFLKEINLNCVKSIKPVQKNSNEPEMIVYTSGSTGKPKGVIHSVNSLFNAITGMHNKYTDLNENDNFANVAPFSFILGIQCALAVLSSPANPRLVLVNPSILSNPSIFIDYLNKYHVNKIAIGANLLPIIKKQKTGLERVYIGGDRSQDVYIDTIKTYNSYGASELGGGAFMFCIDKNYSNVPIGNPFSGLAYYILDDNNKETNEGELCISGAVALGYLNLPEESKKAFISNPFYEKDGYKRMFRTGDIARKDKNGNITIIGRKDFMVKINGQRVELEEIENNLKQIKEIKNAAVRYFNIDNQNYLVAYYVADAKLDEKYLTKKLSSSLASYMIPNFFVKLDKLPLLMNGKVNRLALPKFNPEINKMIYVAPTNDIEKAICNAFSKIFNIKQVGV
ncbi:MAG: AMP-binding protein, partial [Bacilli bacterium]|nr:AMP-binding protein [Bacilli bacterium]